jgi:7,8-dihydroneopterin aldolase/epimerase/oxygenase
VTQIELFGLRVFGYHGVEEWERREGQLFLFDVWLELPEGAAASDRLEDTIDYTQVAALVQEVSDARSVKLLESVASAVADAIMERFAVERARVRVRKPQVRLEPAAEHSAVSVVRRRA